MMQVTRAIGQLTICYMVFFSFTFFAGTEDQQNATISQTSEQSRHFMSLFERLTLKYQQPTEYDAELTSELVEDFEEDDAILSNSTIVSLPNTGTLSECTDEDIESKKQLFFDTTRYKTLDDWNAKIATIIPNLRLHNPYAVTKNVVSSKEMRTLLTAYLYQMVGQLRNAHWPSTKKPGDYPAFFQENYVLLRHNYLPFVEKLEVTPGSKTIFGGDLHGDVLSLRATLNKLKANGRIDNNFKITNDKMFIIFLGDYTDRGHYGLECLYAIHRLKLMNPKNVILLRGNHEDAELTKSYGFDEELYIKYNSDNAHEILRLIHRAYDLMPVALYLGCHDSASQITNYLLCSHAGIEPKYITKGLLDSSKPEAYDFLDTSDLKNDDQQNSPLTNTYKRLASLWTDFLVNPTAETEFRIGRGYALSKKNTEQLLCNQSTEKSKVCGLVRAHQHGRLSSNPMMQLIYDVEGKTRNHLGIAKLWQQPGDPEFNTNKLWKGIVVTLGVGPENMAFNQHKINSSDFELGFYAYGELTTAQQYENWTLEAKRIPFPDGIIPDWRKVPARKRANSVN